MRYVLSITKWEEKTPEELKAEVEARNYEDRRFTSDSQFERQQQKDKATVVLSTSVDEKQFEIIRKSALEVF
jgi:hypothetical protein